MDSITNDESGSVTVTINAEELVKITIVKTTGIVALSEDNASIITTSGETIKLDEVTDISPSPPPIKPRFFGGIALAAGSIATSAGGNQSQPSPPLTFTYINGIKVSLK
ncbi:hypothetical protein G7025_04405 [Pseudomonas lurida]|uniref:hypothetical protein n=1 Tax=Pseudomonas TaxID=286 RepID=UPI0015E48948|nr:MULTISPECIES: hypothetical protein [Pseudomonas]MBA1292589.1 hypothetical protein [Pseudomonas lurida]